MQNDSHADLIRQLEELSDQVLVCQHSPETPAPLRELLKSTAEPCDPVLARSIKELMDRKAPGRSERLRMKIDVLRRAARSRETEQIFRAYGALELVTPVRHKGKTVHVLSTGPLKISPWTRQEKETLAAICGLQPGELPPVLEEAAVYDSSQVKMLVRKQAVLAQGLEQLLKATESSPEEPTALPSSLGLDLLQPSFAEHLDLMFNTVQQELRKPQPYAPSTIQRMQTAMQRGRHLTAQIRKLSQDTHATVKKVSVHAILKHWQKELTKQYPSLRMTLRPDAEDDRVTTNPQQLQHMLFTLIASVADGLPEGRAVMGLSTRNIEKDKRSFLHLEIRDSGGLATFAGVGGQTDQQVLQEQNEAAEEFVDWFTLASRMDAELHVLRDEGVVTRAELLLPLEGSTVRATDPAGRGSHLIWIVEDDDREYESLLHMLQPSDLQCTRFTSAAELKEKFALAAASPDLVLLKYYLPDQRGAEVRTWLYEQDSALPVILVSGLQATHPGIATANSLPSTLYLQKPFDSGALLEMVKMNLDDTLPG